MSLSIILSKAGPPHFLPGEVISGFVVAEMDHKKPCEILSVVLQGKASVAIVKSLPSGLRRTLETSEDYVYEPSTLLEDATVPEGNSKYPFSLDLPHDVPCSFVGTHGFVKYSIEASMRCPVPNLEVISTLPIIVKGSLNLNECHLLLDFGPTEVTHQMNGGWCCCRGNRDVTAQLSIPKRALIFGDFLAFKLVIDNDSSSDLMSVLVQLVLTTTCKARGENIATEKVIDQMAGPAVSRKTCHTWDVENFDIPVILPVGLPPTGLGGLCNIIDVQYSFKVSLFVEQGCCDGSAIFSVPILLGTVAVDES